MTRLLGGGYGGDHDVVVVLTAVTLSAAGDRYQLAALLIDVEREYRDGPDCPDVRVMLKMALIILGAAVPWIVESVALSW